MTNDPRGLMVRIKSYFRPARTAPGPRQGCDRSSDLLTGKEAGPASRPFPRSAEKKAAQDRAGEANGSWGRTYDGGNRGPRARAGSRPTTSARASIEDGHDVDQDPEITTAGAVITTPGKIAFHL